MVSGLFGPPGRLVAFHVDRELPLEQEPVISLCMVDSTVLETTQKQLIVK